MSVVVLAVFMLMVVGASQQHGVMLCETQEQKHVGGGDSGGAEVGGGDGW